MLDTKIIKILQKIITFSLILLFCGRAFAATSKLPDMLVSQTTVETGDVPPGVNYFTDLNICVQMGANAWPNSWQCTGFQTADNILHTTSDQVLSGQDPQYIQLRVRIEGTYVSGHTPINTLAMKIGVGAYGSNSLTWSNSSNIGPGDNTFRYSNGVEPPGGLIDKVGIGFTAGSDNSGSVLTAIRIGIENNWTGNQPEYFETPNIVPSQSAIASTCQGNDFSSAGCADWAGLDHPAVAIAAQKTPARTITYGGMAGNFAVLNPNLDDHYGLDSSTLKLNGGCQYPPIVSARCFAFGRYAADPTSLISIGGRLLTSRTVVKNNFGETSVILETPALFYGNNFVSGDISAGDILNNFNLWGKNLVQSNGNINSNLDASWSLSGYKVNNQSQSFWSDSTDSSFGQFSKEIEVLANNATQTSQSLINSGSPLYLQNSVSTDSILAAGTDINKYPEGRVWVVDGDLTINQDISYFGTGTIIVKGNLIVNNGVQLSPHVSDPNAKLGIIVLGNDTVAGNATFLGGNNINALIFCKGIFSFPANMDNADMRGSFVGSGFDIKASNISFRYDAISEGKRPPGFRFLSIPTTKEKGNLND